MRASAIDLVSRITARLERREGGGVREQRRSTLLNALILYADMTVSASEMTSDSREPLPPA